MHCLTEVVHWGLKGSCDISLHITQNFFLVTSTITYPSLRFSMWLTRSLWLSLTLGWLIIASQTNKFVALRSAITNIKLHCPHRGDKDFKTKYLSSLNKIWTQTKVINQSFITSCAQENGNEISKNTKKFTKRTLQKNLKWWKGQFPVSIISASTSQSFHVNYVVKTSIIVVEMQLPNVVYYVSSGYIFFFKS